MREYELNDIKYRVYEEHGVEVSLRHHLVACLACRRLWRPEGWQPWRMDETSTGWWLCPEGCNGARAAAVDAESAK
jgi:hypothetical protein